MLNKGAVRTLTALLSAVSPLAHAFAAAPLAEITNGAVQVKFYLPDTANGFYRGTRFDWSGVIADLRFQGHSYYGLWFTKTDPKVHDFVYAGPDIIAGPCTAITGPAEEFVAALGYDEAKVGGTFVKIGVGVLRKPDNKKYDSFRLYELVDPGKWSIKKHATSIEFRQEIHDPSSGYGYVYTKVLKLVDHKPELVIEHTLRNVGTLPIHMSTYNHNFLVLDQEPPSPAFSISFPFTPTINENLNKGLARVESKAIVFLKTLTDEERVFTPVGGFSNTPDDNKIRIENTKAKAGMLIEADRPLAKMALWSIRSVLAIEPFTDIAVAPGSESTWTYRYEYYTLPRQNGD